MTGADGVHESLQGERMRERIRERIAAAGGWLPFDEYMQTALYEPGLGYYSAGARKFGAGGDFTTSPEMSALFGRCLAGQCWQVLETLDGGDILEIGAGSGVLAADLLATLAERGAAPNRYRILEVSADLRDRQRQRLARLPAALADRVEWLNEPPAQDWQGMLIANEVLDALPCECFAWRNGKAFERGVELAGEEFTWAERAASGARIAELEALQEAAGAQWPAEYLSETCKRVMPWIAAVTRSLKQGVALFTDYGLTRREYYHPQRSAGTLRVHRRHRASEEVFAEPGLADLTAWVDFTRVAEAADAADLQVLGYCSQAALLLALGIEAEVAAAENERMRLHRSAEARRLLMPGEMGESFKAMALGRGVDLPLAGFALQNQLERL